MAVALKTHQINVRMTDEHLAMLDGIRRAAAKSGDPIPTVGDIMREALLEKYDREIRHARKRVSA